MSHIKNIQTYKSRSIEIFLALKKLTFHHISLPTTHQATDLKHNPKRMMTAPVPPQMNSTQIDETLEL